MQRALIRAGTFIRINIVFETVSGRIIADIGRVVGTI